MIITKQFALTSNQYFKILVSLFLKKNWWILVIIWLLAFSTLLKNYSTNYFYFVFAVFYTVFIIVRLWRYSHAKENSNFFRLRHYEIEAEKITGFVKGGSESTTMVADFIKVINIKRYYLLYYSKDAVVFIPKDSFQSPADEMWFQKEIITRGGWLRK